MTHCCSQCSFTANFESALKMHHQLHHESSSSPLFSETTGSYSVGNSRTFPRNKSRHRPSSDDDDFKVLKPPNYTSSAHRLFDRLRMRICGSRQALFAHPETSPSIERDNAVDPLTSECTSKGVLKADSLVSRNSIMSDRDIHSPNTVKESYGCHLCSYVADRITVLDRHLLNHHNIGLENLLKLVLAKTRDGLNEQPDADLLSTNKPYYKPQSEELEEDEFILETETPKIKILRNAATNTDLKWCDIPDLKDNCRIITDELEKLMASPSEFSNKDELFNKMRTLNEVMCKFADSTNTLKKVIAKGSSKKSRHTVPGHLSSIPEPLFNMGLGDQDREWDRAHSENYARNRHRPEKLKMSAESFYF